MQLISIWTEKSVNYFLSYCALSWFFSNKYLVLGKSGR